MPLQIRIILLTGITEVQPSPPKVPQTSWLSGKQKRLVLFWKKASGGEAVWKGRGQSIVTHSQYQMPCQEEHKDHLNCLRIHVTSVSFNHFIPSYSMLEWCGEQFPIPSNTPASLISWGKRHSYESRQALCRDKASISWPWTEGGFQLLWIRDIRQGSPHGDQPRARKSNGSGKQGPNLKKTVKERSLARLFRDTFCISLFSSFCSPLKLFKSLF